MKILHAGILLISAVATLRGARRRLTTQLGDDIEGDASQGKGLTKSGGPGNAGVVALSGSGQRLAIGAPKNDGPPKEGPQNPLVPPDLKHGSVRVHQWFEEQGFWMQIGPDIYGRPDEEMGFAVALSESGDVLAVGGLGIDVDAGPGIVRVFQHIMPEQEPVERDWLQVGGDLTGDKNGERFGSALALSDVGGILAVGVPNSGKRLGHVSVYSRSGGVSFADETWDKMGKDVDGEAEDDRAGFALDLSADGLVLAVGARFASGNGAFSGHVRVFEFGEEWTQLGEDIDGKAPLDKSGRSVSLSEDGTRVAIGAVDARNDESARAGHARVFELQEATWVQLGDDVDGLFEGDEAGTSVALSASGDVLAVGSPGAGRGEVRIFAFDGATNWYQLHEDLEGDKRGDRFGETLSLSHDGKALAVGSLLADGGRGVAKVFALDEPADQTPMPSPKPTPAPVPGETPPPSPKPSARPSRDPTAAPTNPPGSDGAARLAPVGLLLAVVALL